MQLPPEGENYDQGLQVIWNKGYLWFCPSLRYELTLKDVSAVPQLMHLTDKERQCPPKFKAAARSEQYIKPWDTLRPLRVETTLDSLVEACVFHGITSEKELEQVAKKEEEAAVAAEKEAEEGAMEVEEEDTEEHKTDV